MCSHEGDLTPKQGRPDNEDQHHRPVPEVPEELGHPTASVWYKAETIRRAF